MPRVAKLFRNGRSHAVRLPAEYRFEASEVFIRRDPGNGDVILSRRPESWKDFFVLVKDLEVPEGFLPTGTTSRPKSESSPDRLLRDLPRPLSFRRRPCVAEKSRSETEATTRFLPRKLGNACGSSE
jgi:antitoxin VapB